MAKSNVIRHDRFWAGISQDDRLQQDGEYTYGRDIDIRQGQFLQLAKKPENITNESASWSILSTYYDIGTGRFYYGCSDGVLRRTTDHITYTDVYATSPSQPILNIVVALGSGGNTMFFWTSQFMYYNVQFIDDSTFTKVTSGLNSSDCRQAIKYSSTFIYFVNGLYLSYVDANTPGTVTNYGSFTSGGGGFVSRNLITGITEHANSFWVYDSLGRMYVIDQNIQAVVSVKNFKEPIIGVYNNSSYDLVLTESGTYYKAIYINGGVGPESHQLLRRYVYSEYVYNVVGGTNKTDGIRFNFVMNANSDATFCENSTLVFFKANEGGDDVIYSYGQKNNSLPSSLSIISGKRGDGSEWGTITALYTVNSYLYVAGNSGVTRYVEKILLEDADDTQIYQNSGYIVTRVDTAGIYEKPKQAGKLIIGADIPDGTSIKIYYSMNEGSFNLLGTEIGFDEIQGGTGTATLIQRTIPSQSFNELAIKIELLTTDSTISPRLFSLEYSPIIAKLN